MTRKFGLLALVGSLALLAGGCGGGGSNEPLTKAKYVKQMTAIAKELSMSINGLGSVTDAKSAATALSKVQDDLRGAVKQLKAISPPADVKAPHEALTQAASDFADQLDPIIVKLNNGDLSALSAVTTLKAFKALQVANDKITKLGYKINA